jgi:hypothetical protein
MFLQNCVSASRFAMALKAHQHPSPRERGRKCRVDILLSEDDLLIGDFHRFFDTRVIRSKGSGKDLLQTYLRSDRKVRETSPAFYARFASSELVLSDCLAMLSEVWSCEMFLLLAEAAASASCSSRSFRLKRVNGPLKPTLKRTTHPIAAVIFSSIVSASRSEPTKSLNLCP